MKFPRTFVFILIAFLFVIACDGISKKQKPDPVPSTKNQEIDEIKRTHREIDSIKSLKKKKSKRFDTLKPGVATLEISEE